MTVEELRSHQNVACAALRESELRAALGQNVDFDGSTVLKPVSKVWPMGFSWSSHVASCQMVRSVVAAVFREEDTPTDEGGLPPSSEEALSIAADDVVHFRRASDRVLQDLALLPFSQLDECWERIGLIPKASKRRART